MSLQHLSISAQWDDDTEIWEATSKDVPGLAVASPTIIELKKDLKVCIPKLLELNGIAPTPFRVSIRGNIHV